MLETRRSDERGGADHGWLRTRHTFSFAGYVDRRWMGYRSLRVINEDRVAPGRGFGRHPHRDMEILSYVLEGGLRHRDSMGNGSVVRPGEIQRMSAGTGVQHSEMNASSTEPVRFLQIWIIPERRGLAPGYAQQAFEDDERHNRLCLLASPDEGGRSVRIHQDVRVYATRLDPGRGVTFERTADRHVWIQVAAGVATVAGVDLRAGDGAFTSDLGELSLVGGDGGGEVLLFDLG